MIRNRELRLLPISLLISAILNGVFVISSFLIDYSKPLSRFEKVITDMGKPGWNMAQQLMPGHDFGSLILGVICSLVFYAAVIWILLIVSAAIRRLTTPSSGTESH